MIGGVHNSDISILDIFLTFLKIGTITIGGGYMMVPTIQAEISRKGWIPEEELPDMVALSQSAPGLLTVNMAIFCGYRLRGIAGSIAATAGSILSPFIIILLIAAYFASLNDNPIVVRVFNGVRPVAVAIIAAYACKLFRSNVKWWQWAVTLVSVICIVFLKVSAIYILLVVIVLSIAVMAMIQRRTGK